MTASSMSKNLPWERAPLAIKQLAHDGKALVHPLAACRRIHAAVRDLATILAAYSYAEYQPPGRDPVDIRQLAGHEYRMA